MTAKPDGDDRTAYGGYFCVPEKKEWKHLVTFSTITKGDAAEGLLLVRRGLPAQQGVDDEGAAGEFGNGWVKPAKGDWVPLDEGPVHRGQQPGAEHRRRRTSGGRFFLATGGDIENKTTKLRDTDRPRQGEINAKPPTDLPKFEEK